MKFPHFLQPDKTDCGPTCLRIICKHHGRQFSLATLRDLTFKNRTGVSLLGISDAAEKIGFRSQGCKITFQALSEAQMPCIVHMAQNHFVVIHKIRNNKIYVSDPAIGLIQYTKQEFLSLWSGSPSNGAESGIALLITPTPKFYENKNEPDQKLKLSYLLEYLRPYKKLVIQLLLSFLVASLLGLIFPFLTQSIVDIGISTGDLDFIILVLVSQLLLTIGQTSIDVIRGWLMLYLTSRISISLVSDFIIKIMKLPIRFFDSKLVGDLVQRMSDNNRIQSFLTGSLINMSFSIFIFIIYSFVLGYYDLKILLIFYVGSGLYFLWVVNFLKRRKELDYKQFAEASMNQSSLYEMITGMQEIKLNNYERQKRWQWERIQAKVFKISIKAMVLNQNQKVGSFFINQSKNIIISFLTAKAVIDGDMTMGMMVAIQYILGQLNSPVNDAIGFIQSAQDASISLERLGEIHNKEDEERFQNEAITELGEDRDIEFQNVSFAYEGPRSAKVLNNISITIPKQKITAIVGTSGSGKTTLLKMMLGFYEPQDGKVLVGNADLSRYSIELWRNKCGVVMQDGFIFSETITNNIVTGEEVIDRQRLLFACRFANILDFIEQLPLKFNTKIGVEGVGLSSGQKQRILIARAIYKNSDFIFFDEATNALDTENESVINKNLLQYKEMGKTLIIVAHRLSTVRNADQIIVLNKGSVVEQGTHECLIEKKGQYYSLIQNQLELG